MSVLKYSQGNSHFRLRDRFFWHFILLSCYLFTTLIACAPVGPDYQAPQEKLPADWHEISTDNTVHIDAEELEHWWKLFADPRLDSLILRATLANYDLQIASSRVLQARAEYGIVKGGTAPQVDIEGNFANSGRSKNVSGSSGISQNFFQAGFDAGWELDVFGGLRRKVEAAGARLESAQENRTDVLISLQAEVARNYLELRGSQQRLATAENNLAAQQKTYKLARDRQTSGFGTQLDVAQAGALLALNEAQLPALKNSIGQTDYRLCLLLGLPPGALTHEFSDASGLPNPPVILPQTLPSELLRRRPDIRSAERQLAAATADVGVAVAALFPQFSLTGLIGLQSSSFGDLLSSGSRYWSVGPSISWSLFNAGSVRAGIERNQARLTEAQINYEKTVLDALAEVESALLALHRETEIRQSLSAAASAAQHALTLATGRYHAGLSGMLDVLVSERTLYQSQDQLSLSSQRLNTDLVALFKSLGGGWKITVTAQPEAVGDSKS